MVTSKQSPNWSSGELEAARGSWEIQLTPEEAAAVDGSVPSYANLCSMRQRSQTDLSKNILDLIYKGPGVAVLKGAPLEGAEEWLWGLGLALGQPVPQTLDGTLVGRVEDAGAQHDNPEHRGHKTAAGLGFHSDRTDVIALHCIRKAEHGGRSLLASAAYVLETLDAEHPELGEIARQPFPYDRRGEEHPGEAPWAQMPLFAFDGERVVSRYVRRFIESSQRHKGAPKLSNKQIATMNALDQILDRPETTYSMDLEPGDVQFIENHSIMHARTEFSGNRLLLRLWFSTSFSPQLPSEFAAVYGSVVAGTVRGGVWPDADHPLRGKSLATLQ